VLAVSIVAAAIAIALGAVVWHGHNTSFDTWAFNQAHRSIGSETGLTLLSFTTPAISITLLVVVIAFAALFRRWEVAALAVAGPACTLLLIELVLKPLVQRRLGPGVGVFRFDIVVPDVYPSGHEAVVASTVCVLAIATSRIPMRRSTRAVVLALLAGWTVVAAVGLVRSFWHYATDTLGAVCVSVAVVSVVALGIDAAKPRLTRRVREAELAVS
jgi:hypothetical protein